MTRTVRRGLAALLTACGLIGAAALIEPGPAAALGPGQVCVFNAPTGGNGWIGHDGWGYLIGGTNQWIYGATENYSGARQINPATTSATGTASATGTRWWVRSPTPASRHSTTSTATTTRPTSVTAPAPHPWVQRTPRGTPPAVAVTTGLPTTHCTRSTTFCTPTTARSRCRHPPSARPTSGTPSSVNNEPQPSPDGAPRLTSPDQTEPEPAATRAGAAPNHR